MNKTKIAIFEDEETLQSIEELNDAEEEPSDDEIEDFFTPIQVERPPQIAASMVEVIPLKDDRFSFGGTWYHLTKGKKQLVPVDVRDFLLMSKQIPRIRNTW